MLISERIARGLLVKYYNNNNTNNIRIIHDNTRLLIIIIVVVVVVIIIVVLLLLLFYLPAAAWPGPWDFCKFLPPRRMRILCIRHTLHILRHICCTHSSDAITHTHTHTPHTHPVRRAAIILNYGRLTIVIISYHLYSALHDFLFSAVHGGAHSLPPPP